MLLNLEKLDQALDRSLEAAVDPSLWPEILDRLTAATGSFGSNIIPAAARSPDLIIATDSVRAPLEHYFDNGWHINEWRLRGVPLLSRNGTARDQEYTTREDFERHEYYRWQAKFGIGKTCIIGFSSPDDLLCLTLHRTLESDFFGDQEAAVFQMMRERLMVSATMMRTLSAQKVDGMAEAFETTGLAAVFFDRFCRVTKVTPSAEQLLGKELRISNRALCSQVHAETVALQKRMQSVTTERWLRPDGTNGVVYIKREGERPLLIRIQRLGGNLPDFFAHSVGVCLMEDIGRAPRPNTQGLRELFGLTAKEASVAMLISQGASLQMIAEAESISYETARAHLKSIFVKTDTNRQAELTALIAGMSLAFG